jgi:hypothetical protein
MKNSILRPLALAALAFVVIGCDQGRENPPDASVRVMNVAPGFPFLRYARERTEPSDVQFGTGITGGTYDEDTYDFRIYSRDIASNANILEREFTKQLSTGTLYTFVLAQSGTAVQELILEAPELAATATQAQVLAAHAAEGQPAMDIFFEPTGTDIAGAVPWGSVAFLGTLAPRNVTPGDYEITVTAAGNRASVLLKTATFTAGAGETLALVITPAGESSVAPISITVGSSSFGGLIDVNAPAAVRVINAAADAAPRDVVFNGQFTPPLFAAVPFAAPTAFTPIAPGAEIPVNVTPPGNPGVLELDQKLALGGTRKHTLMILGDAGALTHILGIEGSRRLTDEATLSFYNAARQFTSLDLLVLPAGADPATALAALTLAPGLISTSISAPPGSYNAYLRQTGTTTLVAGPIPVTVAAAGIYGFLATNGPDSVTATVTLLDDFQ